MKYAKMFFGDTIFMFFARTILSSATADSAIACGDEILMYSIIMKVSGTKCVGKFFVKNLRPFTDSEHVLLTHPILL